MAAADALVASATLVLGARSDKTARLPQVIDALYKEFGKDECRAVMQGGAKQWFEQYPLDFRVDAHDAGGHPPWHTVTLIGSEWQTVAATSTAVANSEQGTFHSAASDPIAEADYVARLVTHLRGRTHELLPSLGIAVPKPDGVPSNLSKVLQRHPDIFSLHRVGASDAVSLVQGTAEAGTHNVTTAGPEVLCFVYGLHLLFSNSERGWPSTKDELRIETGPLCSGMGAKLYQLSMLGGVKVLSGAVLVWNIEKIRLLVLSTPPTIRHEAEVLVLCAKMSARTSNSATADDFASDEAIEQLGFVETSNEPLRGAAFSVDCGPLHVEACTPPASLPEPDAEPPSQQSTDPTTRLLEAMLSNVDAEQPDREADVVTRGIALGMLRARTGMLRLEDRAETAEARAEVAEARVATLEAELRQAGQMLSNALEAQMHLEGRLLQMASASAVVQGEPMSVAEAKSWSSRGYRPTVGARRRQ